MTVVLTDINELRREQARRTYNRDHALEALTVAGARGVSNIDLMAIAGARAGARVQELRDRGHVIDCVHETGGQWRYILRPVTPAPGQPGYLASLVPVASIDRGRVIPTPPPTGHEPAATGLLFDL
jgi:hypothetical protein